MPKNKQKSVDSISDICFNAGMNAREMKKHILLLALTKLEELQTTSRLYELELILDKEPTMAQFNRFNTVLEQMSLEAESKI